MNEKPILGTFSKGIDGSVSINFGVSGGAHCDPHCRHHPESVANDPTNACYAVRSELRPDRRGLAAKLERHETMPAVLVCGRALLELQERHRKGKPIPWVRISTNGSVPQPDQVRGKKLFRSQLRALLSWCRDNGIPVHLPVETYAKARFYRALAGDLVTVRESVQGQRRFLTASGATSAVAGQPSQTMLERVREANSLAQSRFERTGRKTIVCPAVRASFLARLKLREPNSKAKCGHCQACAQPHMDVVYPLH